jgi:hypothetical protein
MEREPSVLVVHVIQQKHVKAYMYEYALYMRSIYAIKICYIYIYH